MVTKEKIQNGQRTQVTRSEAKTESPVKGGAQSTLLKTEKT